MQGIYIQANLELPVLLQIWIIVQPEYILVCGSNVIEEAHLLLLYIQNVHLPVYIWNIC